MTEALLLVLSPVAFFGLYLLLGYNWIEALMGALIWTIILIGLHNWKEASRDKTRIEHQSIQAMPINTQEKPAT